ncbi:MAG: glycosyltransferase family 4 protein [Halomonas sp.]
MRERLAGVQNLAFVTANHQLLGHGAVGKADIVHAHEAKGVHWACWHHLTRRVPYLLTRRVDTLVHEKFINRLCYSRAEKRVAISRAIQKSLDDKGWGDVDLIPSAMAGLPHSPEKTAAFRSQFPDRFLVGHAGALVDRHKGQRVLLKAARNLATQHPDIHFVFFGQGEDAEELKRESEGMDNVTWMGFKENIGDYLAGLDVFAFPSHNEGLGSVLLDVMDLGVPIVASDVGGIPDIVSHEDTGLLFTSGDSDGLTQALERLRDSYRLREALSGSAKQQLTRYSAEVMAESYLELYKSIDYEAGGRFHG